MSSSNYSQNLLKSTVMIFFSLFLSSPLLGQSEEICPVLYDNFALKRGSPLIIDDSRLNKPNCRIDGNGNTTCQLSCFYGPRNGPGTSFTFDIRWTTNYVARNVLEHGVCVSTSLSRSLPDTNRQAVIFFGADSRPPAADRLAREILAKVAPKAAPCPGAGNVAKSCGDIASQMTAAALTRRSIENELKALKDPEKKVLESLKNLAQLNEAIKALENPNYIGPGTELADKFRRDGEWRRRFARSYLLLADADPLFLAQALRSYLNNKIKYYSSAEKRKEELIGEELATALKERTARSDLIRQGCQSEAVLQPCYIDGNWSLAGTPSPSHDWIELDLWNFSAFESDVFKATRKRDSLVENLSLFGKFGILPISDNELDGQIEVVFFKTCDEALGTLTLWGNNQRFTVRLKKGRF